MSKLTLQQLESHLWSSADILRGSIDSSDYKNYIFGMFFLKRISDVFEEEADAIEKREIKAGTDPKTAKQVALEDPDEHQFFVPKRARWSEIRKVSEQVGDALNKACAALEEANGTKLEGVLAGIDFNDDRKLGDSKARDSVLSRLVQHFSTLNVRNDNLSEPDMMGRAYEYLIEKFADDAGKKGGEFYTPKPVVELIVKLLKPTEKMRICDPTCGSGGMLIESAHYVESQGGNIRNISLFGQEKNLGTWAICKMNMLLHGMPDARIEKGDTIRDPKLLEDGELMLFDRVIANPPFSLDDWGQGEAEADKLGRFSYGVPSKSKGDFAFIQHMIASLNSKGRLGVVMPHGVLFRGASEGKIRQGLIEDDLLEAVIGIAPNLFYGTGIPAAILIFNKSKPKDHKGKVYFINASECFESGKNQNRLRPADIERIVKSFDNYSDEENFSKVVTTDEIQENEYNLNITRYAPIIEEEVKVDIRAELKKLRELEAQRAAAEAKMNSFLKELGFE